MKTNEQILSEALKEIRDLPIIASSQIPGIDLYMDQVTTFMEEHLGGHRRGTDEKVLTKTMINNYAKNKLLPAPEKKKYSLEHMLVLIFIYYFKGVLSLQDIQSVLGPVTEKYFRNEDGICLKDIYDEAFAPNEDLTSMIEQDIHLYAERSASTFSSISEEDRDDIQMFSLICSLCYDIYIKKRMIEKLIDKKTENL